MDCSVASSARCFEGPAFCRFVGNWLAVTGALLDWPVHKVSNVFITLYNEKFGRTRADTTF